MSIFLAATTVLIFSVLSIASIMFESIQHPNLIDNRVIFRFTRLCIFSSFLSTGVIVYGAVLLVVWNNLLVKFL